MQSSEELVENLVHALMHELPAAAEVEQVRLFELQVRLLSPIGQDLRGYRGQIEYIWRGDGVMFGRAAVEDSSGSPVALATGDVWKLSGPVTRERRVDGRPSGRKNPDRKLERGQRGCWNPPLLR